MAINWFPGHMHKAIKEIKKLLPQVDLIIEVLDARIPYASSNPVIAEFRGDTPTIKLLNKADLADPEQTEQWIEFFQLDDSVRSMAVSQENPDKIRSVIGMVNDMFATKVEKSQIINVMITGIPNVGKSTILNTLTNRQIAKTGNEPAVTKGQQRIKLTDEFILWDTPGILWGKFENQQAAYRLAATGAIKETAISNDDIAFWTAQYLLEIAPEKLMARYDFDRKPHDEVEFMDSVGTKRGCLGRGGRIDYEKVAKIFLTELRNLTIGRITLETPELMQREEQELAILREEMAAKEAEKGQKKKKRRKR